MIIKQQYHCIFLFNIIYQLYNYCDLRRNHITHTSILCLYLYFVFYRD